MRRAAAFSIAALIAIGASAAQSGTRATTYQRFAANAKFKYFIDYGSSPRSVYNGNYSREFSYRINAITVFDGRSVSVLKRFLLVDGSAVVIESRTKSAGTSRVPVRCDAADDTTDGATYSAGRVSVSSAGVVVDPGPAVKWNLCAATESLPTHHLPGGPQFKVPAPAKSRFTGDERFEYSCSKEFEHDFNPPGRPNTHSFYGQVDFYARFTPIPASNLAAAKTALRDRFGESLRVTGGGGGGACR